MSDPTIPAGMKAYGSAHPDYPKPPADWDHGRVYLERESLKGGGESWRWAGGGDDYMLDWRHGASGVVPIIAYTPALSTPTTPDEGLSASDEREIVEMVTAWRSSLANPASWMEKLRGLLAPSEGANYSATAAADPKPFATGESGLPLYTTADAESDAVDRVTQAGEEARAREVLATKITHAAITVEHGPERYADQAQAGNWPIWRVALAAARAALKGER